MPPGKKEHLKPEEIALIRQWIDAGAPRARRGEESGRPDRVPAEDRAEGRTEEGRSTRSRSPPKGGLLAEGSFGSVRLLDAATRQPVRTLAGVAGKVNALDLLRRRRDALRRRGRRRLERHRLSVARERRHAGAEIRGAHGCALRARAFARRADARDGQLRSEDQAVEHGDRRGDRRCSRGTTAASSA